MTLRQLASRQRLAVHPSPGHHHLTKDGRYAAVIVIDERDEHEDGNPSDFLGVLIDSRVDVRVESGHRRQAEVFGDSYADGAEDLGESRDFCQDGIRSMLI